MPKNIQVPPWAICRGGAPPPHTRGILCPHLPSILCHVVCVFFRVWFRWLGFSSLLAILLTFHVCHVDKFQLGNETSYGCLWLYRRLNCPIILFHTPWNKDPVIKQPGFNGKEGFSRGSGGGSIIFCATPLTIQFLKLSLTPPTPIYPICSNFWKIYLHLLALRFFGKVAEVHTFNVLLVC